jgi:hypothetical protein
MNRWINDVLRMGTLLFPLVWILSLGAQSTNTASQSPQMEWNAASLSLIQSNGYYGRIARLKNGQLVCGFDFERKIWVRHSDDEGKTWRKPVKVAEWPFGRLTNTELLQLRGGPLVCFYNERPRRTSGKSRETRTQQNPEETHPYTICMARSDDHGQTWQKPEMLYIAGREFINGCWEPAAIELPSGEVQVFFSNEGPYRESDEQEIDLLRSIDGARTWSPPEKVSFRARARDGMPVPLVLKDGGGIAFSIEDNGLSGNFKPTIVFTSLKDNWHSGARGPGSTNRWSALQNLPAPHVSASAPYLRQMPSGETLLSFQRSETGEMQKAYMVVCIGDAEARHFDFPSRPFPIAEGSAQLWNSLFIKSSDTVIAVSETTIHGIPGIWSIEGRLVRK